MEPPIFNHVTGEQTETTTATAEELSNAAEQLSDSDAVDEEDLESNSPGLPLVAKADVEELKLRGATNPAPSSQTTLDAQLPEEKKSATTTPTIEIKAETATKKEDAQRFTNESDGEDDVLQDYRRAELKYMIQRFCKVNNIPSFSAWCELGGSVDQVREFFRHNEDETP